MREIELFEPVKQWLQDGGYQVYSEVQTDTGSKRADVVGVHGFIYTVVEV